MHEGMTGVRIAGEQGEIFAAESVEPVQDGRDFGLGGGLEVSPKLGTILFLCRNACGIGSCVEIFEPGDVGFVHKASSGGPDGHASSVFVLMLNGTVHQALAQGRLRAFE